MCNGKGSSSVDRLSCFVFNTSHFAYFLMQYGRHALQIIGRKHICFWSRNTWRFVLSMTKIWSWRSVDLGRWVNVDLLLAWKAVELLFYFVANCYLFCCVCYVKSFELFEFHSCSYCECIFEGV